MTSTRPDGLLRDNRGAIMLMGLFMACFLIGSLWFTVGIGDAIVFKQRMQEASDHAVFSSAAVHARGMNFIASLNLVMYAITAVWLILSVCHTILTLASWFLWGVCAVPTQQWACPVAKAVDALDDYVVVPAKDAWEDTMVKVGLPAAAALQKGIAIGYPWYGAVEGYSVGDDYKTTALTFSPSMIPGATLTRGLDRKIGLPVVAEKMDKLCEYVGADVVMSLIPGAVGRFARYAGSFIGGALKWAYCTDSPWDNDNGPKAMWKQAKNGNDWMQVWSFTMSSKYADTSDKRVTLGSGPNKTGTDTSKPAPGYYAQSEFYFDCDGKWEDDQCNGDILYDKAIYAMNWRARLRRVRTPDIVGMIGSYVGEVLVSSISRYLGNRINGSQVAKDIGAGGDINKWLFGWGVYNIQRDLEDGARKLLPNPSGGPSAGTDLIH